MRGTALISWGDLSPAHSLSHHLTPPHSLSLLLLPFPARLNYTSHYDPNHSSSSPWPRLTWFTWLRQQQDVKFQNFRSVVCSYSFTASLLSLSLAHYVTHWLATFRSGLLKGSILGAVELQGLCGSYCPCPHLFRLCRKRLPRSSARELRHHQREFPESFSHQCFTSREQSEWCRLRRRKLTWDRLCKLHLSCHRAEFVIALG